MPFSIFWDDYTMPVVENKLCNPYENKINDLLCTTENDLIHLK